MTKLKKNQIVTKLKKSNCDKSQNSNFDKNSKTQIVTKLKKNQIVTKLKKSNCNKTQKI